MRPSALSPAYDRPERPGYEVRVRAKKFLWGSAGITQNMTFHHALVLEIHNDLFGDAITLGTRVGSGAETLLGALDPGECLAIPLQDISGVFATCASESTVSCRLH